MTHEPHIVESFNIDHNLVVAPFVRTAGTTILQHGDTLTKYDIRFTQPNIKHLEWAVVHSIEHCLATTLRQVTTGVIDISPFGCHTGFYAVTDTQTIPTREHFLQILKEAMNLMLSFSTTPASTPKECGWAKAHDIEGAKNAVKEFLNHTDAKLLSVYR